MNIFYNFDSKTCYIEGRINCNCTECSQRLLDDSVTLFFEDNGLWAETLDKSDIRTRFSSLNSAFCLDDNRLVDTIHACIKCPPTTTTTSEEKILCTFKTVFEGCDVVWKAEFRSCSPDVITAHQLNPLKIALNASCTSPSVLATEVDRKETTALQDVHKGGPFLTKDAFAKFAEAAKQLFHKEESIDTDMVSIVASPPPCDNLNTENTEEDDSMEELRRRSNLQRRLAKEAEKIKSTPPKRRCLFK